MKNATLCCIMHCELMRERMNITINNTVRPFSTKEFVADTNLPMKIIKVCTDNDTGYTTTPYWCEEIIIIKMLSGSITLIQQGRHIELQKMDVCVIPARCIHYFENNGPCELYYATASESMIISNNGVSIDYLNSMFGVDGPVVVRVKADTELGERMNSVILEMGELLEKKPPAYELFSISLIYKFFALIFSSVDQIQIVELNTDERYSNSIHTLIKYINENYWRSITIKELCDKGAVSRTRCFQLFMQNLGCTPLEYVHDVRLKNASNLLSITSMSISDISQQCGFTDQSHLTKLFKKRFGVTPLQYRKNCRSYRN